MTGANNLIRNEPMRKPRVLGFRKTNYYHVISRATDRRYIFGEEEKAFFHQIMRKQEAFTGVRVITYCIMSNHWHALVEVPSLEEIKDAELVGRIRRFYPKQRAKELLQEFEQALDHAENSGSDVWLNELRNRYLFRMGDLSMFVRELKERFSKGYNRQHGRRGALWEERFKSVLIEDSEDALSTIAAYIDLNPVRAGIVAHPKEYPFCGYAEATAGNEAARNGIRTILMNSDQNMSWRKISSQYRMLLASSNRQTPEEVKAMPENDGKLDRNELLRCRVRYFSDGVALGSPSFVEEVFENNRNLFSEKRKNGARKMRGGDWNDLCTLRDLTRAVAAPE